MGVADHSLVIAVAEDDADDRLLLEEARIENRLRNQFIFAEDGLELLDLLYQRGRYSHLRGTPRPGLILLDLNMPRMDGREVLQKIKEDPALRGIPVVALTTSRAEEDVIRTYDLGVSGFITKPVDFEGLIAVVRDLKRYWLEIVELPPSRPAM